MVKMSKSFTSVLFSFVLTMYVKDVTKNELHNYEMYIFLLNK